VLLAALLAIAPACRQIAGIQDLPKPCADPLTIDDMEDGDASICQNNGRQGAWFNFGDGSGGTQSFTPNADTNGERGASRRAVHFTGSGYTSWGAIAGINLDSDGASRQAYNAGGTGGLTFWMKSNTPVTVELPILATALIADNGTCVEGTPDCNDHFRFPITSPAAAWTQYRVPFTALRRSGSATWNPADLLGVQFHVTQGESFDVWIDDIAFYYCAAPECVPTCTDADLSLACAKTSRHPAGCFPGWATCAVADTWCADPTLVDDMEDGDELACRFAARQGHWYTFSQDPVSAYQFGEDAIPGGRGASTRAAHLSASGLKGWGAGMGIAVSAPGSDRYDASAAGGIHFWLKGNATVRVQLRIPATTPVAAASAGTCTDGWDCDNSFHFVVTSSGDEWVEQRVPFAALRQGAGGTATWDASQLLAIEFSAPQLDFDFWVDDVSFYSCTGDACVPTCPTPPLTVACPVSRVYPASCWPAGTDCASPPEYIIGQAVWGSGPNDVWIGGTSMNAKGATLRWNGAGWTSLASPDVDAIWGLWGSGPNDVWTVGVRGTIRHWTGSDWAAVASGTTSNLYQGIWGSGPNDVWAGGAAGTLVHWDGAIWSAVPALTTHDIWGVWGTGPSDVWAAGSGGTILHRTGAGWSAVASGTTLDLDGVWGSGPSDVWAVGSAVVHWNSTAWAAVPSGTTNYLDGVWGSGPNDVWAVGQAGTILHWNGSAWTRVTSGTDIWITSVWGTSASDVWAVGADNTVLHFDGATWTPVAISGSTP
jgi:hypothetical protein